MQHSSSYRMYLKENLPLTDSACDVHIVKLQLTPEPGSIVTPFTAGQFVRMGIPGVSDPAPAYFAIASSPHETEYYEFVVKKTEGMANYLINLEPSAVIEIEGPMGKGFDLTPFHGLDVILMGVGTGIAPLRSVWENIIQHRSSFASVSIYAGFLTPLHCLLTNELEALEQHEIQVHVSLAKGGHGWDGPIGFVQDGLLKDRPDGKHAVACLAGMSTMVDACTETLQHLGFDDSRILLNF
ncbi:MAG: FAD-binding oxidoreductase [Mariprofundaceae bacterium]